MIVLTVKAADGSSTVIELPQPNVLTPQTANYLLDGAGGYLTTDQGDRLLAE